MKILILGFSSIVERKVFPALTKIEKITEIEIASLSKESIHGITKIYNDYDFALNNSDAELVYISLPNSFHFEYLEKSIKHNKNVIVDKPFLINFEEYTQIKNLLENSSSFIFESNVFTFHNGWKEFSKISLKNSNTGTLFANFSIPSLPAENFRNKQNMGGGAFNDMGPYASSIGLKFWNQTVKEVYINKTYEKNIITSFSIIAKYGGGKNLIGNFSFNKDYRNYVAFKTLDSFTYLTPAFSSPESVNMKILQINGDNSIITSIEKDDTFKNFIEESINVIEKNQLSKSREKLYTPINEFFTFKQLLK